MYEVYIERSAERDLKKLPAEEFYRLISHIKTLAENPGRQDVVSSSVPRMIGVFG